MTQGTQFLHAADPVKSHPLTYRATFPFTVCRFLSEFAVPFPQFVVSLSNLLPPFSQFGVTFLNLLLSSSVSLLFSVFCLISQFDAPFPQFPSHICCFFSQYVLPFSGYGVLPPHFYCTLQLVLPLYFITDNILIALFNDVFNYYDYI